MPIKNVSLYEYCECGKRFIPPSPGITLCKQCRTEYGELLPPGEFDIYADNGMKKKITGEFNEFNSDYFRESDYN